MGAVIVKIREKLRVVELLIMAFVVVLLLAASAPNVQAPSYSTTNTAGAIQLGN